MSSVVKIHGSAHLPDHAPNPPGSNLPLSRSTLPQAGNKSSALAQNSGATGNKSSLYGQTIKPRHPTLDRSQFPDRTPEVSDSPERRRDATGLLQFNLHILRFDASPILCASLINQPDRINGVWSVNEPG